MGTFPMRGKRPLLRLCRADGKVKILTWKGDGVPGIDHRTRGAKPRYIDLPTAHCMPTGNEN